MGQETYSSREELEYLVRAGYALIYLVSPEEERVESAVRDIAKKRGRKLIAWSITEGFVSLDGGSSYQDIKDPLRALDFVLNFEDDVICILRDFHPFLKDPSIVRRLRDLNRDFKESDYQQHLVLLSSTYAAPAEIEKDLAVVDYDLPGRDVLEEIVWELAVAVFR